MRLVAFSDLHLDAPFSSGGPAVARLRRESLRRALAAICDLAAEVDATAWTTRCTPLSEDHRWFGPETDTEQTGPELVALDARIHAPGRVAQQAG